jgi:hypothetical protein
MPGWAFYPTIVADDVTNDYIKIDFRLSTECWDPTTRTL